ncbi:MAG: alpha/beta fold hydrolase [Candidatus Acidiferrales bacterium]
MEGHRLRFLFVLAIAVIAFALPASAFASADDSAPGRFLDVEAGKIYYEECGSGPDAVILVHDGIAHSAVWDAVWPAFCKEFHTVRYDRRGYGRSPAATSWYYETDDLFLLVRHLKIDHAFIVGSSHGGELTIDFTLAHPKVVDGIVLVGAVVSGYGFSDHFLNRGIANNKPLEKNDTAGMIANWANDKYLLAADHPAAKKQLHDLLTANPQDLNHPDFPRPTPDALPRLNEIRIPTLILVGDIDIPDVHAHAGVIEAGIPNARRIVVEDAGHLMYMEKPEEFTRLVTTFIERNRK